MAIKCEFGCGRDARYIFQSGKYKGVICCSNQVFACPTWNDKNRTKAWLKEIDSLCDCGHKHRGPNTPVICPACKRVNSWISVKEVSNVKPSRKT